MTQYIWGVNSISNCRQYFFYDWPFPDLSSVSILIFSLILLSKHYLTIDKRAEEKTINK